MDMLKTLAKFTCFIYSVTFFSSYGFCTEFLSVTAQPSEGIYALFRKYRLPLTTPYLDKFSELNQDHLENDQLILGKSYLLPVYITRFNGKTIRSSLGMNDYPSARKIEDYNNRLWRDGIKKNPYRVDQELWVPYFVFKPTISQPELPYFGPGQTTIKSIDARLKGYVYYLVSGHGGPDPGAIGKQSNRHLSEDEYAYDITLRLALFLLQHQATVYMIVQDPDDGIRDDKYLTMDKDELHFGSREIPEDRKERLEQRVSIINELFEAQQATAKKQQVVVIHCDSRSKGKRIDIFFYHSPGSRSGKHLATVMLKKIRAKYNSKQPYRGYNGVVKSRLLYMLTQTKPTTVYIELGNIRNDFDQRRFVISNNRQAIANWLGAALLDDR